MRPTGEQTSDETGPGVQDPAPEARCPNREKVAVKAYEICCGRGCEDGHDVEDWIEAERQPDKETAGEPRE